MKTILTKRKTFFTKTLLLDFYLYHRYKDIMLQIRSGMYPLIFYDTL